VHDPYAQYDLDRLPRIHRLALQMRGLGASDELIAECLDIGPETVRPLIEVAHAKVANAARAARAPEESPPR
jgi:hypothetical protein